MTESRKKISQKKLKEFVKEEFLLEEFLHKARKRYQEMGKPKKDPAGQWVQSQEQMKKK